MPDPTLLPVAAWRRLATHALERAGASPVQAEPTARALVAAEIDGQAGHGLMRVAGYAAQLRRGKVRGDAAPALSRLSPAAVRIDAGHGFAYPALDLAVEALAGGASRMAVAAAAVTRSHHFGQAGATVERLAERGLVALLFGNSPQAMRLHGGTRTRLGTNPIAFAAPVTGRAPLVIDLALSTAARGRIAAAARAGKPIPEGWAVDGEGAATTDAEAALAGSLLPMGGAKGAALAVMVEVLAAALTGSAWGWEATSVLDAQGAPPDLGQTLVALDPQAFSGGVFAQRMTALMEAFEEDGARPPGDRRLRRREEAAARGLPVAEALHAEITSLARA